MQVDFLTEMSLLLLRWQSLRKHVKCTLTLCVYSFQTMSMFLHGQLVTLFHIMLVCFLKNIELVKALCKCRMPEFRLGSELTLLVFVLIFVPVMLPVLSLQFLSFFVSYANS